GLENDRGLVVIVVRKNDVHAIHPKGIALRTGLRFGQTVRRFFIMFAFTLALLEGVEIVEKVVAHFLEVIGDAATGILFLKFVNDNIDQTGSGFLFMLAQLPG